MMDMVEVERDRLASPEAFFATLMAERTAYRTYLDYFALVDGKAASAEIAACFTENAAVAYHMKGPPMIFRGRDEYAAFLERAMPPQEMTAHVVGQHWFDWVDGTPRLHSYVTSWQWYVVNAPRGEARPADFTTIGYSIDDFEQVDGRWLIARRVARPVAGLVAAGSPPPALH